MPACLLRISQVLLSRLHARRRLGPLLLSSTLPVCLLKCPAWVSEGRHAAGGGKGPSEQQTQLALVCGWHPLTPVPSLSFPPRPRQIEPSPLPLVLTPGFRDRLTNSIHMFISLSSTPEAGFRVNPPLPLQMGDQTFPPSLSLPESRSS